MADEKKKSGFWKKVGGALAEVLGQLLGSKLAK